MLSPVVRNIVVLFCLIFAVTTVTYGQTLRPTVRDAAYGTDPAQRMDVYVPDGAKSAAIMVMVHGGAWRFGDKSRNPGCPQ